MLPTQFRIAVLLAAATLPLAAAAQKKASEHTVEDFFRLPHYSQVELSPDGSKISALAPLKGRNNLVIVDIKARKPSVITSFDALDVTEVVWVNNERLCFRVTDGQEVTGQFNYKGTYCINHDGSDQRNFSNIGQRDLSIRGRVRLVTFLGRIYDGSPDIMVAARVRSADSQDVYRLNTVTSRYELLTGEAPPPGFVRRWVLDRNHVPRVAVCQPERKGSELVKRSIWHRDSANGKWERIAEVEVIGDDWFTGDAWEPLAFDYDNTTLYVSANNGRDKRAIYKYDTKARKLGDLLFENPLVDITGNLVFHHGQKKLLGVRYQADKPVYEWIDPDTRRLQRQVDATFPKTINFLVLPQETATNALIYSSSDVDPGAFHLMDRVKPSIETLVKSREWINPAVMPERRFIQYKARDGRTIPAYLTLPQGVEPKGLPLIVNIHGGPWARSYTWLMWSRWPEASFFASRGYAVLEPEPRGSTGWGKDHFLSSFKQWGQAMQDDITDGALHLAKEGIVDKGRMCLHGGSYGGYATAMGLAKDPDLWRCGSPFIAVTDLFMFQNVTYSDIATESDFFQTDFKRMVGDSSADKDMFTKYSPNLQADKIKAPVLLTMGSDDVRVPQVHGDKFESNLRAAGKKVEYVVYPGEGHGYNKSENVYDFYRRLEKFFGENLKK